MPYPLRPSVLLPEIVIPSVLILREPLTIHFVDKQIFLILDCVRKK